MQSIITSGFIPLKVSDGSLKRAIKDIKALSVNKVEITCIPADHRAWGQLKADGSLIVKH